MKELIKAEIYNNIIRSSNTFFWNIGIPAGFTVVIALTFDLTYLEFVLPGLLAISVMFSSLFGNVLGLVWEREIKIYRRLKATPVSLHEIITSKIAGNIMVGIMQVLLLLMIAWVWGIDLKLNILLLFSVMLTIFTFVPLSFLLAAISKDIQSASNLTNLVSFPLIYLSETFFNLEQAHIVLQSAAWINPLLYCRKVFRYSIYSTENLTVTSIEILFPVVFGILCILIASKKFKWETIE